MQVVHGKIQVIILCNLKDHQREFLREKILKGCFAVVVDTSDRLAEYYSGWMKAKRKSSEHGISYLMSVLPKKKESKKDIF